MDVTKFRKYLWKLHLFPLTLSVFHTRANKYVAPFIHAYNNLEGISMCDAIIINMLFPVFKINYTIDPMPLNVRTS